MKRIISLILILATVLLCLSGCGKDDKNNNSDNKQNGSGAVDDGFPALDFEGESMTLAVRAVKYITCLDLDNHLPITDDSIVAAAKTRNDYVQNRLNLQVDYYHLPGASSGKTVYEIYVGLYNANDGFADGMIYNIDVMMRLMMTGIFRNALDDTRENYFDFEKGSWMKEAMISASLEEDLNSKVFLVCNDYFLNTLAMVHVVFVNETVYNDLKGDEDAIVTFQQTVLDGDWTYDTMASLAKQAYTNNGSDASKIDKDDQLGVVMGQYSPAAIITYSSNIDYIEKKSDGYQYATNVTSLSRIVDKGLAIYKGKGTFIGSNDTELTDTFAKGKSLFYIGGLLRDLERDYFSALKCSTVPYPKVNESDSYSTVCGTSAIVGAAVKTGNFTPVSAYWQLSGLHSETAKIKYYTDGLGLKYETGTNTQQLLDLIYDTTTFNRTYYWDLYIKSSNSEAVPVSDCMLNSFKDGQNKVASVWAATITLKNQALAKAYKDWKAL